MSHNFAREFEKCCEICDKNAGDGRDEEETKGI
jgi:hypothetical protein